MSEIWEWLTWAIPGPQSHSHELASLQGLQASEGLMEAKGSLSKVAHSHASSQRWLLWGCLSSLPHRLLHGLPDIDTADGCPQSKWCRRSKAKASVFYDQSQKSQIPHFFNTLLVSHVSHSSCDKRQHKGVNNRKHWEALGAIWRLVTTRADTCKEGISSLMMGINPGLC